MIVLKPGSSIIEVVVATALISMGIISALSLTNYSQKQNSYAKLFNEATTYNSQAADWLRGEKSRLGWAAFLSKIGAGSPSYCLQTLSDIASPNGTCSTAQTIPGTTFRRQMDITNNGSGKVTVTISTKWEEKATRTVTLNMELGQWQ